MSTQDELVSLLQRIEANQQHALELQRTHLELAKAQQEQSRKTIEESITLQRAAVARQSQMAKVLLPVFAILLILLGYLLVRWDIL